MFFKTPFKAALAAFFLLSSPAWADQVVLYNGDTISGSISLIQDDEPLAFRTVYGQDLIIPWSSIAALYDDQGTALPFPDGYAPQQIAAAIPPAQAPAPETQPSKDTELAAIEPAAADAKQDEAEDPSAYKWSGRINLGGNLQDGNSNKKSVAFDTDIKARNAKNRFTFGSDVNWASDEGEETENDQSVEGEYNRFLTDKWFVGIGQDFEIDKISALDLRSRSGVFGGYQFFERDDLNLQAELGSDYIYEKFDSGDREENIAAAWALDYDQKLLSEKLQVFHKHDLAVPFDESDAFLFESESGLRVPLGFGVVGTGQVDFDWDNAPAEDVREEDTTYSLKLGYEW